MSEGSGAQRWGSLARVISVYLKVGIKVGGGAGEDRSATARDDPGIGKALGRRVGADLSPCAGAVKVGENEVGRGLI